MTCLRWVLFAAVVLIACDPTGPTADDVGLADADARATQDADISPEGTPDADEDTNAEAPVHPLLVDTFLNIAHRGGGRLAPEETIPAYDNANAVGADVLEIDVHATLDGVVVCMHDADVDRTTDGTGAIREMTFDTLRGLDAGYRFTADGGKTFPFRGQGVVVPTMDEILAAFPDVPIAIEIKQELPSIAADVVALIEAHDAVDRTVVASFFATTSAEVRAAGPDVLSALSLAEMFDLFELDPADEATYVAPGRVLQAPQDFVTPNLLERARRFGLAVHVWTVNERDEMELLLDLGVDGIFTDDPALLSQVLQERTR